MQSLGKAGSLELRPWKLHVESAASRAVFTGDSVHSTIQPSHRHFLQNPVALSILHLTNPWILLKELVKINLRSDGLCPVFEIDDFT